MLVILYIIAGLLIGVREVNKRKGINQMLTEGHLVIFVVYLVFWLPIHLLRYLNGKGYDFDLK